MDITKFLTDTTTRKVTFEILPPLKGDSIQKIYDTLDPLMEFEPPYINVTYHREEVVYRTHEGGLLERKVVRKRPGTVAISAAIKFRYGVEVVPHMICGGFTKEETENALIDLHFLGIHNVLALRGDMQRNERSFTPTAEGHAHACDLVKQIIGMNHGQYQDEELQHPLKTRFVVGVAGYPEKHEEAPNMQRDLMHLKEKVDAGAKYIITQMFFDNTKYFRFVELCREIGITVPIIPGLKPLSTKNQICTLAKTFKVDIPFGLADAMEKAKDAQAAWNVGVEWTTQQARELYKAGVPIVHFYTMGKADNIRRIVKAVL